MLALLGIPWMFSAFGVIDSGGNVTLKVVEGIFNVSILKQTQTLQLVCHVIQKNYE